LSPDGLADEALAIFSISRRWGSVNTGDRPRA